MKIYFQFLALEGGKLAPKCTYKSVGKENNKEVDCPLQIKESKNILIGDNNKVDWEYCESLKLEIPA